MNILVTALPADGANYRVVKTVANGNWDNGNAVALNIGMNEVTVSEVSFARSVKFQFSSGAIEVADISINGNSIPCNIEPCEDLDADGICDDVDDCVGNFDALGICNGTCMEDSNANGICDADEDFVDPSTYCGPGTTWDALRSVRRRGYVHGGFGWRWDNRHVRFARIPCNFWNHLHLTLMSS